VAVPLERSDTESPLYSPQSATGCSAMFCLSRRGQDVAWARTARPSPRVVDSRQRDRLLPRPTKADQTSRTADGPLAFWMNWSGTSRLGAGTSLLVTGTLTVVPSSGRLRSKVPLVATSKIARRKDAEYSLLAHIKLASNGAMSSSAEAIMVLRPADHFALHEKWLHAQTKEIDGAQ